MNIKNKIFTIPNILTFIRIALVPLLIYFLLQKDSQSKWISLYIFMLATASDFFDGYLARRLRQDSEIGRFLDPFADKMLVISTLIVFLFLDKQISLWMVLVIIGRDILITLMRYIGIRKNIEIRTTKFAKYKTSFQMLSIFLILNIFIVRSYQTDVDQTFTEGYKLGKSKISIVIHAFQKGVNKNTKLEEKKKEFASSIPYFLMLLTVIFTSVSGIRYIFTNYQVFLPEQKKEKINSV